jgi:uncharacterized protein (DUF1778 family)
MTTSVKRGRPPLPTGEGAVSHLHLRVSRDQKAAYVRAAVAEKKKLSEWVTQNLDKASSD